MLNTLSKRNTCLILLALGLFAYSRHLNIHGAEYRDDEIFYFKSAQEMLATHNYLSPTYFGEDRFEKPILFYWLVMLSYKIFGINWFAARFVAVVFAALTAGVTYLLVWELFAGGAKHSKARQLEKGAVQELAVLSALILMTGPLFLRHARNVVPDMPLNFFIVAALYFAARFINGSRPSMDSILFFFCCALGFMIKGFAAVIVPMGTLCIYAVVSKETAALKSIGWLRGWALFLIIVLPWFVYMIYAHGIGYFNYMVIDETKNRLVEIKPGNPVLKKMKEFFNHALFYAGTIFSYYLPWSAFLTLGIPLALSKNGEKIGNIYPLRFLLIWFGVVFCFFSIMYFVINHYMLVLSTPLAILVSYFLLNSFFGNQKIEAAKERIIKYFIIFILCAGIAVYSFLIIFLVHPLKVWLLGVLAGGIFLFCVLMKNRKGIFYPLLLGLFLLWVNAQTSLLTDAGVTPHAALQKFAQTVNAQRHGNDLIGVGSHDIHENEFQVYFDTPVIKASSDEADLTQQRLAELFRTHRAVFCLIKEKDFQIFLVPFGYNVEVIQEDYIIRKRWALDRGFFMAVLTLDRQKVHGYLMEKLLLLKKAHG